MMTFEEINETIKVISYFDINRMRPLRFQWRDRTFRISRVNGVWTDINGRSKDYHFHVHTTNSGSFELIYNDTSLKWKLGRVCLDD